MTLARRALFLERGEIRFDGSIDELLERDDLLRPVFLASVGSVIGTTTPAASGNGAAAHAAPTGADGATAVATLSPPPPTLDPPPTPAAPPPTVSTPPPPPAPPPGSPGAARGHRAQEPGQRQPPGNALWTGGNGLWVTGPTTPPGAGNGTGTADTGSPQ